jgi:hypothetical protein
VILTNAYREEIERLEALQNKTQEAMSDFSRAESLWGVPDRQMEALKLARDALLLLQDVGSFAGGERKAVDAWLRERNAD